MGADDSGVLKTNRLRLEPLREEHADEMVGVLSHAELYEYTGGTAPTLDELKRRYRAQAAGPSAGEEIWFNWIFREIDGGHVAGHVQATVVGDAAEVAWLVARDFQGHGLGTEAATAMCSWLRSSGVRMVTAHIHPDHGASQGISLRLGLARTGEVDSDGEEVWASPDAG